VQYFFYNERNYNLMAEIIAFLIKQNITQQKIESYKSSTARIRKTNLAEISKRLCTLEFPQNTVQNAFEKLTENIDTGQITGYLIEALLYIDLKLDFGDTISHFMKQRDTILSELIDLNSNYAETQILILPKLSCQWKSKTVDKGINSLMKFYFFVNVQRLQEYKVRNFVLNRTDGFNMNKIRIGISPLTNENSLHICHNTSKDGKRIIAVNRDGVAPEIITSTTEKLCRIIEIATEQQVDILMFPEMLGTKEMIQEGLAKIAELNYCPDCPNPPFLILLPTIWGKEDTGLQKGNNTNKLKVAISDCIIDGVSFKEAFTQQKQNPYFASEGSTNGELEAIDSDKIINLLHVPKLGRIAFPICADWLNQDYNEILLNTLEASLILCPSFSKGFDDFIQSCSQSSTDKCCIIWCNSCAVQHLYTQKKFMPFQVEDIGCAGLPLEWRTYAPKKVQPLCKNKCGKEYCLFYIDIPLCYEKNKESTKELEWIHLTN